MCDTARGFTYIYIYMHNTHTTRFHNRSGWARVSNASRLPSPAPVMLFNAPGHTRAKSWPLWIPMCATTRRSRRSCSQAYASGGNTRDRAASRRVLPRGRPRELRRRGSSRPRRSRTESPREAACRRASEAKWNPRYGSIGVRQTRLCSHIAILACNTTQRTHTRIA